MNKEQIELLEDIMWGISFLKVDIEKNTPKDANIKAINQIQDNLNKLYKDLK